MLKKLSKWCSKGNCTCFFDRVFSIDISPECKEHDADYDNQIGRYKADFKFFIGICKKSKWSFLLAIPIYLLVALLGWHWYNKAKRLKVEKL